MSKKIFTLGQVMILLFGIIVISYSISSEVGVVSGIVIGGSNYKIGDKVTVTIGGQTKTGYLASTGRTDLPHAITSTRGGTDFVNFVSGNDQSRYFKPSTVSSMGKISPEINAAQSPGGMPLRASVSDTNADLESYEDYWGKDEIYEDSDIVDSSQIQSGETITILPNENYYLTASGEIAPLNDFGPGKRPLEEGGRTLTPQEAKGILDSRAISSEYGEVDPKILTDQGELTQFEMDANYDAMVDQKRAQAKKLIKKPGAIPDPKDFDTDYIKTESGDYVQIGDKSNPEVIKALDGKKLDIKTAEQFGETADWSFSEGLGGHLMSAMIQAPLAQQVTNWVVYQGTDLTEAQAKVVGDAAGAGVLAYHLTQGAREQFTGKLGAQQSTGWGWGVGAAVALWYIYENYEDLDTKSVTIQCTVWEAPTGGRNCEKCNNKFFGCSEYQCKSLGKGCNLLNPGSEEELCTWINRHDIDAPEITPWDDVLDTEIYEYTPTDVISPPDRGVKIIMKPEVSTRDTECIDAYTPLKFGVTVDEPATCKIDLTRKDNFEEMAFYFGSNSLARYNHSHTMSVPSINATGTVAETGLEMEAYVRCEDANGNSNLANFVFKFCVDEGEDYTAPLITGTSRTNPSPVPYNITNVSIYLYTNEEASCKWDFFDKSYIQMAYQMSAPTIRIGGGVIGYQTWANLSGIRDNAENDFYFRCNDTSGNVNRESHHLTLIGTQPLFIDWVRPNGTISDSVDPVQSKLEAKTSSGYQDGRAFCSYKSSVSTGSYVPFLYDPFDMTHQHSHDLTFTGNQQGIGYNYSIRCHDAAGNVDIKEAIFSVKTDKVEPVVVRAYKEDRYLKLITNEAGNCTYNTDENIGCKFDEGIVMTTLSEDEHFVEWDTQETFYIKCQDSFGNPPGPQECSIIARPSEGETS